MPKLEEKLTQLIKESLEKAVTSATAHLAAEIAQLREVNADLSARLAVLEKSPTKPYGSPPEGLFKGSAFLSAVSRAVDEQSEREKKTMNLVIVGLPEPLPGLSDSASPNDQETVTRLAAQMSIPSNKIQRVFRHGQEVEGRARITKIVFDCHDARRRFLTGLRPLLVGQQATPNLKVPFYVRPDLTRDELVAQSELNRKRIALIRAGNDVVIFRGEIMERSERDKLRGGQQSTQQVQLGSNSKN